MVLTKYSENAAILMVWLLLFFYGKTIKFQSAYVGFVIRSFHVRILDVGVLTLGSLMLGAVWQNEFPNFSIHTLGLFVTKKMFATTSIILIYFTKISKLYR